MIWQACEGSRHIKPISGTLYRLVESQEQVATMGYVDTLEEQALLEELLETVKPPYPGIFDDYHYLLKTPFRYPPLDWGSRFGKVSEPSLFYAGCSPLVTLAEAAYYRFVFLFSMEGIEDEDKMRTTHMMFNADYQTDQGMQLQFAPFNQFRAQLVDAQDYSQTQQIGHAMREAGVEAFEYISARDIHSGICVAFYEPDPFCQYEPVSRNQWLCEMTMKEVLFKQFDKQTIMRFPITDFLIADEFPLPAQ